ncbi:MAG: polysaccharide deacetylase family protein [Muribaculaceae bacterium]|nr:polysaccharide deacetylase family protein [Muribaculaceae bacterium]
MNILTFDVEEWFHLLDNDSTRSEEQWLKYEVRIHKNMERIFRILEETNTKATFFIIGWIAKTYPEVVKEIASKYEIGSHTMTHQLVWQQSPEEFKKDVKDSIKLLQDITGQEIKYFRAPGFSIRKSEAWAFEILYDLGIEIDCSVFPAHHAHGGFPEYGEALPKIIEVNGKSIKEFPISCREMGGSPIIYQGGGYFRLFPYHLIKRWARKDKEYLLSYIHPRDLDPDQPIIADLPLARKFKSYVGLKEAEKKLRQFLKDFKFIDIGSANKSIDWNNSQIIIL